MSRVGPLGVSLCLAALIIALAGSPAFAQCDSLPILPPHTGTQDAVHVGITSDPLWNPCAPADPNGVNWTRVFDLPFACANLTCLRIASSGSDSTTSEVKLDGATLGFLPTDAGPDCSFATKQFPVSLSPGLHTLTILSGGGDFAFHDVRLACSSGSTLVCPGNATVYLPVPASDPSLQIPLLITGTTAPLEAFLLDAVFDSTTMAYDSTTASGFTSGWFYFDSNPLAADSIRVGGFTTPAASPMNPDTLGVMHFTTPSPLITDPDSIWAKNFQDDFAGLPDCLGIVTYVPCGHGDVNGNGVLTPADALCAYKCFLNFDVMPPECLFPAIDCERNAADVNCDGICTTTDALWIADRSLCGGAPLHCGGIGPPCPTPFDLGEAVVARISGIRVGPAEIQRGQTARVPLQVQGTGTLRSFGLDLTAPEGLEIVSVQKSEATQDWVAIGQGQQPGVLRLGGFDLTGVDLEGGQWTTLGYLEVHAGSEAAATLAFDLLDLSSELAGAQFVGGQIVILGAVEELPSAFALGDPRPNPSRGSVSVSFLVPSGPSRQVEIDVYNIHGQKVRSLHDGVRAAGQHVVDWDGRDEAGNRVAPGAYFFSMKSDSFQATRKLVQMR